MGKNAPWILHRHFPTQTFPECNCIDSGKHWQHYPSYKADSSGSVPVPSHQATNWCSALWVRKKSREAPVRSVNNVSVDFSGYVLPTSKHLIFIDGGDNPCREQCEEGKFRAEFSGYQDVCRPLAACPADHQGVGCTLAQDTARIESLSHLGVNIFRVGHINIGAGVFYNFFSQPESILL